MPGIPSKKGSHSIGIEVSPRIQRFLYASIVSNLHGKPLKFRFSQMGRFSAYILQLYKTLQDDRTVLHTQYDRDSSSKLEYFFSPQKTLSCIRSGVVFENALHEYFVECCSITPHKT